MRIPSVNPEIGKGFVSDFLFPPAAVDPNTAAVGINTNTSELADASGSPPVAVETPAGTVEMQANSTDNVTVPPPAAAAAASIAATVAVTSFTAGVAAAADAASAAANAAIAAIAAMPPVPTAAATVTAATMPPEHSLAVTAKAAAANATVAATPAAVAVDYGAKTFGELQLLTTRCPSPSPQHGLSLNERWP